MDCNHLKNRYSDRLPAHLLWVQETHRREEICLSCSLSSNIKNQCLVASSCTFVHSLSLLWTKPYKHSLSMLFYSPVLFQTFHETFPSRQHTSLKMKKLLRPWGSRGDCMVSMVLPVASVLPSCGPARRNWSFWRSMRKLPGHRVSMRWSAWPGRPRRMRKQPCNRGEPLHGHAHN